MSLTINHEVCGERHTECGPEHTMSELCTVSTLRFIASHTYFSAPERKFFFCYGSKLRE
jgi:hypothetical protein